MLRNTSNPNLGLPDPLEECDFTTSELDMLLGTELDRRLGEGHDSTNHSDSSRSMTPYDSNAESCSDLSDDDHISVRPVTVTVPDISQASNPAAQVRSNIPTLNFKHLTKHEYHTLLKLSDQTTQFQPGQLCGSYQLPTQLHIHTIHPANMQTGDAEYLQSIYLNKAVISDGGLVPGKDYFSIYPDKSNNSGRYIAVIIRVSAPVRLIELKEENKDILFKLLTQNLSTEIFFANTIYLVNEDPADPASQPTFVILPELISRYIEKKSHENRSKTFNITNRVLGSGCQGTVYASACSLILRGNTVDFNHKIAEDNRAVKILHDQQLKIHHTKSRNSAKHEYKMMARFSELYHPKAPVRDNQSKYNAITSRLFDGIELYELLFGEDVIALTNTQPVSLCIKISEKVQMLHDHGIIHRDLKPENILVKLNPANNDIVDVNIIDLGLAISTEESAIGGADAAGSAQYASPEVWGRRGAVLASDTFALGRIFWQILSGKHISEFINDVPTAQKAAMPAYDALFGKPSANKSHPTFMHTSYYMLVRMNEHNPSLRITLNESIRLLHKIRHKMQKHNSKKQAVASASAHVRFFDSAQQSQTRSNSDALYTAMPAKSNGK